MTVKKLPEITRRRQSVSANVAWWRIYRAMSRQELSSKLPMCQETLRLKLEQRPGSFTLDELVYVANALGTTVEDLICTKVLSDRLTASKEV